MESSKHVYAPSKAIQKVNKKVLPNKQRVLGVSIDKPIPNRSEHYVVCSSPDISWIESPLRHLTGAPSSRLSSIGDFGNHI
jgi:hypothetical protein